MSSRRWAWVTAGFLIAVATLAQTLPDIGEIMYRSRDYRNVLSGCVMSYDKGKHEFVCAANIGMPATVTLTAGVSTTVANTAVTSATVVHCGCDAVSGQVCNTGGRWIAGLHVASVTTGAYNLAHGTAEGDEQVVCVVNAI